MSYIEALSKAMKYCAYQERCQFEVRNKLFQLKVSYDDAENIICDLIAQNFINEERFSELYCRGKFYQKGWGKIKITQHLKQKEVSDYCIKKGLSQINQVDYEQQCLKWIEKKANTLSHLNSFTSQQKIIANLYAKGFDSELSRRLLEEYLKVK